MKPRTLDRSDLVRCISEYNSRDSSVTTRRVADLPGLPTTTIFSPYTQSNPSCVSNPLTRTHFRVPGFTRDYLSSLFPSMRLTSGEQTVYLCAIRRTLLLGSTTIHGLGTRRVHLDTDPLYWCPCSSCLGTGWVGGSRKGGS